MSTVRFFSSILGQVYAQSNIMDWSRGVMNVNAPPIRANAWGGFYSGTGGGTGYPGLLYNQQTVEQYLAVLDMLSEVFMFSITGLAVRFISEAIIESMREIPSIFINVEDTELAEKIKNEVEIYLNKIDVINLIKRILNEFIYYGSYAFALDEEFNLHHLYDPHCVISIVTTNHQEVGYLVNTPSGMAIAPALDREEFDVMDARIFKIGMPDIILYSRLFTNGEKLEEYISYLEEGSYRVKSFSKFYRSNEKDLIVRKDSFIRKYVFAASLPLFYYSRVKLREYIIKDLVIALITLRDLLFPFVLTMTFDNPSLYFETQNYADQLETILNSYVDVAGIIGVKADLTRILYSLTYSVRVLPDYKGSISSLQPLNTDLFTQKVDRYKSDMKEILEDILNEVGIPIDAFTAKTTYWEALRQSERFTSKAKTVASSINKAFSTLCEVYVKKFVKDIPEDLHNFVSIDFFDTTMSSITRSSLAATEISNYMDTVMQLVDNTVSAITERQYFNITESINFVKSYLRYVIPHIETVIDWTKVEELAQQNQEGGGEEEEEDTWDFGAFGGGEEEEETETGEEIGGEVEVGEEETEVE
jgi:hypothetical protein